MKILIAEDELISRNLLKKMLEQMGHTVLVAEDGNCAWEHFRRNPVNIVIADWMMPHMDGLELCRRIRTSSPSNYVYIIILTAKDDRDDLLEVFNAGADDYITKPFDPEELQARIMTSERVVGVEKEYKIRHTAIVESRDELRVILDILDEKIVVIDPGYRITYANRTFRNTTDLQYDKLIGRNIFNISPGLFTHAIREDVPAIIDQVFGTGKSGSIINSIGKGLENQGYTQFCFFPKYRNDAAVDQVVIVSRYFPGCLDK